MAKSFKQMIKDGEVRRADAMKVQLEDLHEEPGFNLRTEGEALEASINSLADFVAAGGQIPPLEVRPRAEGGVWLVDGHRRRRALLKLDAEGRLPRTPNKQRPEVLEAWVPVIAFEGSDADRVARIITSQENEKLSPLELAEGYKRLRAFGWSVEQIAAKVGKTRQHVEQVLTVGNANTDVQNLVAAGHVSATTAAQVVREHGDGAGKVLGAELVRAQASGKKRVTAGSMKGPSIPKPRLEAVHAASRNLIAALEAIDEDSRSLTLPTALVLELRKALEGALPR
ncbi:ParB N-terminal domain-containing protein [Pseudomonas juntendi]|uniref:ParB N-terminal domain-containing protein n=1 Tax=Pseudomonas juntendi TaxID=2666183 RepID=A0ABD4YE36_9PSED|nr:ParB N-terminal domain-containing protein [Pseudomonas juntendi]MDH0757742.1 ParB N-terminal domain-containing protein [Pseudomonas juntendi]MDH1920631.1 ParB N-terminal domain-containing protein [Pseudomonas juntendi]NOY04753.1 ParB N-terminal domain-containing protein [Gammaproteobacteria bacterium]NPA19221.1 ParB N-terminal domain-containing protein [Gammaproteobacteria bacterium]